MQGDRPTAAPRSFPYQHRTVEVVDICAYCDRPFSDAPEARRTRDHIIPKIMGTSGHANIAEVCGACNRAKGAMTPAALRAMAASLSAASARYAGMADRVDNLIAERGLILPT